LILPYFGKERAVESLTWDDVHAWHQSLADTPTQANRALAALRVALRKARRWDGWNLTGPNPATDHELHPERKAQTGRPLTAMEWKRLGPALLHEEDPVQLAALSVYLLTGLRPGEVCSLRWEDLEDGGVIRLDGKTGPRRAVLSERAERLIRTMPRVGGFVFPGRLAGDPLGGENDSHGLGGIWKRMQGAGVTARCYDCRHSWVTAAAEKGVGDDVRRVLSGHAGASGTAHSVYLHATEGMRKAADLVAEELVKRFDADAVEARIAELIQTEKDAKSQHG
jgi:integrase